MRLLFNGKYIAGFASRELWPHDFIARLVCRHVTSFYVLASGPLKTKIFYKTTPDPLYMLEYARYNAHSCSHYDGGLFTAHYALRPVIFFYSSAIGPHLIPLAI